MSKSKDRSIKSFAVPIATAILTFVAALIGAWYGGERAVRAAEIAAEAQMRSTRDLVAAQLNATIIAASEEAAMRERERVYNRIEDVYFAEGLYPVEQGLSTYQITLATAILDVRLWVNRAAGEPTETQILTEQMNEIRAREPVADLLSRDYRLISQSVPRLHRFGSEFVGAIMNTLYGWSRILEDTTDVPILQSQIKEGDKERFLSGALNASQLLQQTGFYLEIRIRQLDDYIWERDYQSYVDFLTTVDEPSFRRFRSELDEYTQLLVTFVDSAGGEEMKWASLQLNIWLNNHLEMNPFRD